MFKTIRDFFRLHRPDQRNARIARFYKQIELYNGYDFMVDPDNEFYAPDAVNDYDRIRELEDNKE